jgi:enterochelin esterase-like enzyme
MLRLANGHREVLAWRLCVAALVGACGGGQPSTSPTGGAGATGAAGVTGAGGAGGTATAGAGSAGTTGAGGALTGVAGSTGAAGVAGDTGGDAAAGTGTGTTDGGDASGVVSDAAPGALTGTQDDPGTTGDGTFPLPGPYADTPESLMRQSGAPTGQLLGPLPYTVTGTYTGWTAGWSGQYWVYVPAEYRPGHRAALAVFQDGLRYVGDPKVDPSVFNLPIVFDNLIHSGDLPVTIAVLINPASKTGLWPGGSDPGRGKQYDTPNDQYGKFLISEFLPAQIFAKYDIVQDPDGWSIGGHSSGGMAAFNVAWFYPDKFHKVITASPSFPNTGGKFPAAILTTTPIKPMRIYHMAGTNDLAGGWYDTNNQAAKDLMMMGYHYRYRPGTGMHYPPAEAAQDFPDALRWLWRGYHTPP